MAPTQKKKPAAKAPRISPIKDAPTSAEATDIIKASDFESMELQIILINTLTKTMVKTEGAIRLVELLEQGMILEVPAKAVAVGHNIILEVYAKPPGAKQFKFSTTAKVEELNPTDDGTVLITVTFIQYDDREWRHFCSSFSSRQEEIERFFQAAKGR